FQLKEDFRPALVEQDLAKSVRNKLVENVRITPKEVQEYFDSIPADKLQFYESEMEIGEIVIYPKPGRDLETYAMDQLRDYKKQVEDGTRKFETLASLYTDDPGSKETGGLYEVNRNEKQWDPIFLSKAFTLKDGQVSSVFKGKHGYHIIQMVSRRGDDATIRHILKIPQVSSIEIGHAIEKLDSVRNLLVDGKMQFGEAVSKFSEDDNSKFTGGRVTAPDGSTVVTIDQLDKDLVLMLKSLTIGEYSKPAVYTDLQGKRGVRIVNIVSKTEPHRENMREDYDKIAQRALEEKKGEALEQWFEKSLNTFYIRIAPEYKSCPEMEKWNPVEISTVKN
ncbi:MAG: peptidylprolyl isomerase, partial [Ginsengibacter sp.]